MMQTLSRQRFPFFLIFLVCLGVLMQWYITEAHLLIIQTIFVGCHLISFAGVFFVYFKTSAQANVATGRMIPVRGGEPITKQQYDMGIASTWMYSSLISCFLVMLVHYQWGSMTPLLFSGLISSKREHENTRDHNETTREQRPALARSKNSSFLFLFVFPLVNLSYSQKHA